jgi:hypothetical protein
MQTGRMCFTSWDEFREEFMVAFCPENEATTALMRLESDCKGNLTDLRRILHLSLAKRNPN